MAFVFDQYVFTSRSTTPTSLMYSIPNSPVAIQSGILEMGWTDFGSRLQKQIKAVNVTIQNVTSPFFGGSAQYTLIIEASFTVGSESQTVTSFLSSAWNSGDSFQTLEFTPGILGKWFRITLQSGENHPGTHSAPIERIVDIEIQYEIGGVL